MSTTFYVGDLVQIIDQSYAIRIDYYEPKRYGRGSVLTGKKNHNFIIVETNVGRDWLCTTNKRPVHDIIIKDTTTNHIYLHTALFLKKVIPRELTINELEKIVGYPIKIVKE